MFDDPLLSVMNWLMYQTLFSLLRTHKYTHEFTHEQLLLTADEAS